MMSWTLDPLAVGGRFREERAHWRDDELASCLILTPRVIAQLESGKLTPDARLLFKMAACGLDIQYILTGVRSSNWYQVAASINRFDELEAEMKQRTREHRQYAREIRRLRQVSKDVPLEVLAGILEKDRSDARHPDRSTAESSEQ